MGKTENEITNYGSYQTLQDNVETTFNADNLYAWDIQIVVEDKIGRTIYNKTIGIGIPIAFIDRLLRSLSINAFPSHQNALEINGSIYISDENGGNTVNVRDGMIVEEGSNALGSYTKWGNGKMICTGTISFPITNWTTWGSIFYYDAAINQSFPAVFIDTPVVSVNNIGGVGAMVYRVVSNASSINQVSVSRPTDYQNTTLTLSYIAIGRWK